MNNHQINIYNSIISENIKEISADILEVSIDQIINNELLKDIPIFGIPCKSYNLIKNISEHFFLKKILYFLFQLKEIPVTKREDFIKKLEKEKKSTKVGEKLLNYINRLDDLNKAEIIGKLYKALILKKISQSEFFRLTSYVDKSFIDDLMILKDFEYPQSENREIYESLSNVGFFKRKIKDNRAQEEYISKNLGRADYKIPQNYEYEINNYGSLLKQFGF